MNIKQLIQANGLTGEPKEIAEALNAPSVTRINHDMQSYRAITNVYGTTFAATILGKLDAASAANPLLKATYNAVCNGGIDFGSPVTQGMVDALTGTLFTSDEASKLKAMGVYQISLCDANNIDPATVESVQSALDEIAAETANGVHSQLVAEVVNECFAVNQFATMAELKAAIANWRE